MTYHEYGINERKTELCFKVPRKKIGYYGLSILEKNIGSPPPGVEYIKIWYDKFKDTGSVGDRKRTGKPSSSDDTMGETY